MKTNKLLITALALTFSLGATAQTVDEIIDKHVVAMGGMEKLNAVKTLHTEQLVSVQGMDIPSKSTVVVGKAMRSELTVMGNSMIQVIAGTSGWMVRPAMMGGTGDPEDMPAEMVNQQSGQLDPFGPLFHHKEKGNTVELVGKEKVDGKETYHLKVTTPAGLVIDEYLDAGTFLLTKATMMQSGQAGEVAYSNYKEVEGVKLAGTTDILTEQAGTITYTTEKIKVNDTVDESIFKKPGK